MNFQDVYEALQNMNWGTHYYVGDFGQKAWSLPVEFPGEFKVEVDKYVNWKGEELYKIIITGRNYYTRYNMLMHNGNLRYCFMGWPWGNRNQDPDENTLQVMQAILSNDQA
jgi:hypothetical protein